MKVAFYKAPGDWLDWTIRTLTRGPYSHTELVFPNGDWFSSSYRDGGVRFKSILAAPGNWDFVDVEADDGILRRWCEKRHGGYDLRAVLSFVMPVGRSRKNWFCSEICLAALHRGGVGLGYRPTQVSPNQLYQILTA